MMKVFVEKEGRSEQIEFSGTARELCRTLAVNSETVLIVRDGTLITEDDEVDGAERVELLSVISGG